MVQKMKNANIEYRIMNVEYRRNVFCLFYKKDWASLLRQIGYESKERNHPSTFCGWIFCGSAVRCSTL